MSEENSDIKEKLLKFDSYDIFGFIVPGAVLVMGIYLHTKLFGFNKINIQVSHLFAFINFTENNWPNFIGKSLICLFCLYICGHLVALLSSAIIDKLLVERTQGYPFQHLFNRTISLNRYAFKMKKFYKAIISLFMLPLVYVAIKGISDLRIILWLTAPFMVLVIFKIIMSLLLLRQINDPFSFRDNRNRQKKLADFLWEYAFKWILWPFVQVFDLFFKSILSALRMYKPFTKDFQVLFIKRFRRVFANLDPSKIDTEVHWLTYSYLCQNHPESNKMIRHWLTLYGFSRNLSAAFLGLLSYNIILNEKDSSIFVFWNVAASSAFLLFLLRYYYLYYNYYSKYIFRSFVTYSLLRDQKSS